jgi:hypothetical protein
MVPSVAQPTAQDPRLHLLQYQMQQFLDRLNVLRPAQPAHFEVQIDRATLVRWQSLPRESHPTPSTAPTDCAPINCAPTDSLTEATHEITATLFVLERTQPRVEPTIRWVIDVAESNYSMLSAESVADVFSSRAQICAGLAIADYWQLMPAQSALKTYHSPSPSGYQQQRLWHVGDQVSPTAIPEMTLRLQEPLPLYFLTRTLKGPRTYPAQALPLQVCSLIGR